jgi:nucleoside 2-deoxyribosyltransferase
VWPIYKTIGVVSSAFVIGKGGSFIYKDREARRVTCVQDVPHRRNDALIFLRSGHLKYSFPLIEDYYRGLHYGESQMKVFLSYEPSSADAFVRKLSNRLKGAGIDPIAINLQNAFGSALNEQSLLELTGSCHKIIVLLNQSYLNNPWNQEEFGAFIQAEAAQQRTDWIVPVVVGKCKYFNVLRRRPISFAGGRSADRFDRCFDSLLGELRCQPQAFVVMSFTNDRVAQMYARTKSVFTRAGYEIVQVSEKTGSFHIVQRIISELSKSDIVLVDFTDNKQNCYYEAGYADALRKDVIFTVEEGTKPHFDLEQRRQIRWRIGELDRFEASLADELKAIRTQHLRRQQEAQGSPETPTAVEDEGTRISLTRKLDGNESLESLTDPVSMPASHPPSPEVTHNPPMAP